MKETEIKLVWESESLRDDKCCSCHICCFESYIRLVVLVILKSGVIFRKPTEFILCEDCRSVQINQELRKKKIQNYSTETFKVPWKVFDELKQTSDLINWVSVAEGIKSS